MAELSKFNKKKASRQKFKRFISMFIAMLFILGDMGLNPVLVATVKACTEDSNSTTVKSVVKPDDFCVQKGTKLNEIIELLPTKLNVVM